VRSTVHDGATTVSNWEFLRTEYRIVDGVESGHNCSLWRGISSELESVTRCSRYLRHRCFSCLLSVGFVWAPKLLHPAGNSKQRDSGPTGHRVSSWINAAAAPTAAAVCLNAFLVPRSFVRLASAADSAPPGPLHRLRFWLLSRGVRAVQTNVPASPTCIRSPAERGRAILTRFRQPDHWILINVHDSTSGKEASKTGACLVADTQGARSSR
jgi:hypothetical protein